MRVLDRFRRNGDDTNSDSDDDQDATASTHSATAEQLAPDDPAPRGEDRSDGGLISLTSPFDLSDWGADSDDVVHTERTRPPDGMTDNWVAYYKNRPLTGVPLDIFTETVTEPGWTATATQENSDGEQVEDEAMTEALTEWGENCAIHACEPDQNLTVLLRELIPARRGKGTVILEKAGSRRDSSALRALVLHDPATFKIYRREDKAILVQPDDDVDVDHPTTPNGMAAAYVQYDDTINEFDDQDEIPFSTADVVKFTHKAQAGNPWGTPLYQRIGTRVDALFRKLADRDHAIRMTGYPHRIYTSESWSRDDAEEYAKGYKQGDYSGYQTRDEDDPRSFAGRVDFTTGSVDVTVEEGSVPDIQDAVMDDIEAIFSEMPVSKFKIAYEEDINQFVVEPQQKTDQQKVDDERRYLERKFQPIFAEKADELADGDYAGTVNFSIEPSQNDNPLMRESFPAENLDSFADAWSKFVKAGVDSVVPPAVWADMMGFDLEEFSEKHGWNPEALTREALDESGQDVQAQMEAMENAPTPGEDGQGGAEDDSEGGGQGVE